MTYKPEEEEEEEEEPEPDITMCVNCEGTGCSVCDYDGVVDRNYLEPNGTN